MGAPGPRWLLRRAPGNAERGLSGLQRLDAIGVVVHERNNLIERGCGGQHSWLGVAADPLIATCAAGDEDQHRERQANERRGWRAMSSLKFARFGHFINFRRSIVRRQTTDEPIPLESV